jgi:Tfp pilus assembly protein PilV
MIARRGMSLLELIAAGVLLAAILSLGLEFLAAAAGQRRATRQRQAAIQEADNLMERLYARPWEDLTPERVGDLRLGDEAGRLLPGGELSIDVAQSADLPDAKRLSVSIHWQDRSGQPANPVRLVAWRYRW